MTRILLVHNHLSRFVSLDRDLLSETASVTEFHQRGRRVDVPALVRAVRANDLVVSWFASWHSFGPVMVASALRKPTATIIGGYDMANLPEIDYGHQRGGVKQWVSRLVVRCSSALTTFSYFSQDEIRRNVGPHVADRVRVLHLGVPDPFGELPAAKERLVLTVGNVSRSNLRRKGHEVFVRAAAEVPEATFVVAGAWLDSAVDELRQIAAPNVIFTNWLDDAALNEYFRRASVYVQASEHEGFGMAVAEAMLAGVIPVVSGAGSLPEVVGPVGVVVDHPTAVTLSVAVRTALEATSAERAAARERVLTSFSLEARQQGLNDLVVAALELHRHGRS